MPDSETENDQVEEVEVETDKEKSVCCSLSCCGLFFFRLLSVLLAICVYIFILFFVFAVGCSILNNTFYTPIFQLSTSLIKDTFIEKILGPVVCILDFGTCLCSAILVYGIYSLIYYLFSCVLDVLEKAWNLYVSEDEDISWKDVFYRVLMIVFIIGVLILFYFFNTEFGILVSAMTTIIMFLFFFVIKFQCIQRKIEEKEKELIDDDSEEEEEEEKNEHKLGEKLTMAQINVPKEDIIEIADSPEEDRNDVNANQNDNLDQQVDVEGAKEDDIIDEEVKVDEPLVEGKKPDKKKPVTKGSRKYSSYSDYSDSSYYSYSKSSNSVVPKSVSPSDRNIYIQNENPAVENDENRKSIPDPSYEQPVNSANENNNIQAQQNSITHDDEDGDGHSSTEIKEVFEEDMPEKMSCTEAISYHFWMLLILLNRVFIKTNMKPQFNMLSRDYSMCRCPRAQPFFKWIIIIALIALHAWYIYVSFGDIEYPVYLICIFAYFIMSLDYNLIDILMNYNRTKENIGEENEIVLWVILGYYGIVFVGYAFSIVYVYTKEQPYFPILKYEENNDLWIKYENNLTMETPPSFCKATTITDNLYSTVDFIMMTTLPRLYAVNNVTHKCYIKPKMRGVFNSTMKYIFGKDYMNQGIEIACYPESGSSSPYLVLTSQKLFENTIDKYKVVDNKFTYEPSEYTPVKSTDYFDSLTLPFKIESQNEQQALKKCMGGKSNTCEKEWQDYTNKYWTAFGDDDKNLTGLEQYEQTLSADSNLYKSRGTLNGRKIAGTHYLIGGCFEGNWGYAYLVEILVKKYSPFLFENCIPFYSLVQSLIPDFFNAIDFANSAIMVITRQSFRDAKRIKDIINHFDFGASFVYGVGHSISGASIKQALSDIDFPAAIFSTISSDYLENLKYHANKNVLNVYDQGSFISEPDAKIHENGQLARIFYNPNVFDTACLTTISCSETQKYRPFCEQVLTQRSEGVVFINRHKVPPKEEFDRIFKEYVKQRDITEVDKK